ncbi:MAG: hypothetical protein DCC88_06975 [Spirobacillus cienkowskii]|jgi:hypothetical protein|uniref:Uncharacterized protein n=1 Tax=Spirobacillus cienkowskii TaxID=495820 RepID=A0A369KQC5_9BACT|nr:MAG: hypothetical protein DCC88_06975 [Spirobacillus cienkowskii]
MLKLKEILSHVSAKGALMTKCPYTWTKSLLSRFATKGHEASQLRVTVLKNNQLAVDTALPAHSARWLVDLIPDDVLEKIRLEGIPIEQIQKEIARQEKLFPREIFTLVEQNREVNVWLE